MARLPADPFGLDYLLKARAVHSMTGENYRSIGLKGDKIVAVSPDPGGLDDLAGPVTVVTDVGDLIVLPAFADAHEHLMEASRNTLLVPVGQARSIAEFMGLISNAAADAKPGQWIVTLMAWHESDLAENRMPTRSARPSPAGRTRLAGRSGPAG